MPVNLKQLTATNEQNRKEHQCVVSEEDYKRVEPLLKLLQRLSEVENSTITVFDMNRKNYLLKSSKFKEMLGYKSPEDIENDDMALFHQIIHPEDLPFVLETENKAYTFFNSLPDEEKKDYKLVYDFRVKNTAGVYMRFIHQLAVLEQDPFGKSWLIMIVTELIAERALNVASKRRMINIKTKKLHIFNEDDESHADMLLTKRETEILSLIAQGLDSQRISEKLFISVNTVNNHRQKILGKTKTDNTTQAILYAKKIGII